MSDIRKPSRKLSESEKIEIKKMLEEGHLQSRIAAKYDVNSGRISEINTGKTPVNISQQSLF